MTDNVAEFMQRVAAACGRDEPAPDPTLIWIKQELARRESVAHRVARLRLLGFGFTCLAMAIAAFVALRFAVPALAATGPAFTAAGIALLPTAAALLAVSAIVWFLGFRPLRNAL